MWLSNYKCPITVNCPITLFNYNFADYLAQNTATYAPIAFEKIVIVMIIIIYCYWYCYCCCYCYCYFTSFFFVYVIRGYEQYGNSGWSISVPSLPVPNYGWIGLAGWWRYTFALSGAAPSLRGWMFRKPKNPELYSHGTGGGYAEGDWDEKFQIIFQKHHSLQSH